MTHSPPVSLASRPLKRRRLRTLALMIWFLLLLTPCACFYFSVQQELTIPLGSAPGQAVRVWLVMESRARGLGFSIGQVASETPTELCVQTTNGYLLWSGRGEDAIFCECYTRPDSRQPWSYVGSTQDTCAAPPVSGG